MNSPVQARSRATEEKILLTAEQLLQGRSFDDVSMADIAAEMDASVGGLYARFASKDALLRALHTRYETYRTAFLTEAFAPVIWHDADLEARVRGICSALVTLMRERRHLLRSFLLRYWATPQEAEGEFSTKLTGIYQYGIDLILARRREINADNPERAAEMALAVIAGGCRDIIVMKPSLAPGAIKAADEELVDVFARAALGILGVSPEGN